MKKTILIIISLLTSVLSFAQMGTLISVGHGGVGPTTQLSTLTDIYTDEEYNHTVLIKSINLKSVNGVTELIPSDAGKFIIIDNIKILIENGTYQGGGSVNPVISIGQNASDFNDIYTSYTITSPESHKIYSLSTDSFDHKYDLTNAIALKIKTASNYMNARCDVKLSYHEITDTSTFYYDYQTETNTLVNRFTTSITIDQKLTIDSCITMLKDSSLFTKLYVFYPFNLHSEQASYQNWKSNNFNLTKTGVTTYTEGDNVLFAINPVAYYNTGFIPSVNMTNKDSVTVGTNIDASTLDGQFFFGSVGSVGTTSRFFAAYSASGNDQVNLFSSTAIAGANWIVLDSNLVMTRSVGTIDVYSGNTKTTSSQTYNGALSDRAVYIGAYNNNGSEGAGGMGTKLRYFYIAKPFTATDVRRMNNIMRWWINAASREF